MSLRTVSIPPRFQAYLAQILATDVQGAQNPLLAINGPFEVLCAKALDDAYLYRLSETGGGWLEGGALNGAVEHLMSCTVAWLRLLHAAEAASPDGLPEATTRILTVLGAARLFWRLSGNQNNIKITELPHWLLWHHDPRVRCAALMCCERMNYMNFTADLEPGCSDEAAQMAFEADTLRWCSTASSEWKAMTAIFNSDSAAVSSDQLMQICWLRFRIIVINQIAEHSAVEHSISLCLAHSAMLGEWSSTWARRLEAWMTADDARCGLASELWAMATARIPSLFIAQVNVSSVATAAWTACKRSLSVAGHPTFRSDGDAMCARCDVVAKTRDMATVPRRSLVVLHVRWLSAADSAGAPVGLLARWIDSDMVRADVFGALVQVAYRLARALYAALAADGGSMDCADGTDVMVHRMASMVRRFHTMLCAYGGHASVTPLTMLSYMPREEGMTEGGGKDFLWYLLSLLEMRPETLCGIIDVLGLCSKRVPVGVTHLLMTARAFPRMCAALRVPGTPTPDSPVGMYANSMRSFVLKAMCLHNDAKQELMAHVDRLVTILLQPKENPLALAEVWQWMPKDAGAIKCKLLDALLGACDAMTPVQAAKTMELVRDPAVSSMAVAAKARLHGHLHQKMALMVALPDVRPAQTTVEDPPLSRYDSAMLIYGAGMGRIPVLLAGLTTPLAQLEALPWIINAMRGGCTDQEGVEASSIVGCADAVLATLSALDGAYDERDMHCKTLGLRYSIYKELLSVRRDQGVRSSSSALRCHDLLRHTLIWTMREVMSKIALPLNDVVKEFFEAVSLHIADCDTDAPMLVPAFIEYVWKDVPALLSSPYCWDMVQMGHRLLQSTVNIWTTTVGNELDDDADADGDEMPLGQHGSKPKKKATKKAAGKLGPGQALNRPAHDALCSQRCEEARWMLRALLPYFRISSIVAAGSGACSEPFAQAASFVQTLVVSSYTGDWLSLDDLLQTSPDEKGMPLLRDAVDVVSGSASEGFDWSLVVANVLSSCVTANDSAGAYRCYRMVLDSTGTSLLRPDGSFDPNDAGRLLCAAGVMRCHSVFVQHLHTAGDNGHDDEPPRKKGPGAKKKAPHLHQPSDTDEAFVCHLVGAVSTALVQVRAKANTEASGTTAKHTAVWTWVDCIINATIGTLIRKSKRTPTAVAMLRTVQARPPELCNSDVFHHPYIWRAFAMRAAADIVRRLASAPEATPNALCVRGTNLLPFPTVLDCAVDAESFFLELGMCLEFCEDGLEDATFLAWAARMMCLLEVPVAPQADDGQMPSRRGRSKAQQLTTRKFVALRVLTDADPSEALLLDEARRALTHLLPSNVPNGTGFALALLPRGSVWQGGMERVGVQQCEAWVLYEEFLTCVVQHARDLQRTREESDAKASAAQQKASHCYLTWWASLQTLSEYIQNPISRLMHADKAFVGTWMRSSPVVDDGMRNLVLDLRNVLLAMRSDPMVTFPRSDNGSIIEVLCRLLRMWTSGPLAYARSAEGYLRSDACNDDDGGASSTSATSIDAAYDYDNDNPDDADEGSYEGSDEGSDGDGDDGDGDDGNGDDGQDGGTDDEADNVSSTEGPIVSQFATTYAALPTVASTQPELRCAGASVNLPGDAFYSFLPPPRSMNELEQSAFAVTSISLDDYIASLMQLLCEGNGDDDDIYANICIVAAASPRLFTAIRTTILRFCGTTVERIPHVRVVVLRLLSSLLVDATVTCHGDQRCATFAMDAACALGALAGAMACIPSQMAPDEEGQLCCMLESFVATKTQDWDSSYPKGRCCVSLAVLNVPPELHAHTALSYERTGSNTARCSLCFRSSTVCYYVCRTCYKFSCCVVCSTMLQGGVPFTVVPKSSPSPAEHWCHLITAASRRQDGLGHDEVHGSTDFSEQLLRNALHWMEHPACTERSFSKLMDLVRGVLMHKAQTDDKAHGSMLELLWRAVQPATQSLLTAWHNAVVAACKGDASGDEATALATMRLSSPARLRTEGPRLHRLVPVIAVALAGGSSPAGETTIGMRHAVGRVVADMVETVRRCLALLSPVAAGVRDAVDVVPCDDQRPLASASELSLVLSTATALEAIETWRCDDEACGAPGRTPSVAHEEVLTRTATQAMIAETNETSALFALVLSSGGCASSNGGTQAKRSSTVTACLREHKQYLQLLLKTVRRPLEVLDAGLSAYIDPTCIPLKVREKRFRGVISAQPSVGSRRLTIIRSKLLESSLDGLKTLHEALKQHPGRRTAVTINFAKERAIDAGGVIREWISLVAQELCKPHGSQEAPLRAVVGTGCVEINPQFTTVKIGQHTNALLIYEYIGVFLGLCLSEGQCVDLHFTRALYKHLTGRHPSLFDLEATDPQLYKNFLLMNKMQSQEEFDGLCQSFTVSGGPDGSQEIPLIPGGADVAVSNANKKQYIRLAADYTMTTRVAGPWTAVMQGIGLLLPMEGLKSFTAEEVELLSCGLSVLDVEAWRANTKLEGYTLSSPQVVWFWDIVAAMRPEDRSRLLQFVHGSSNLPMGGFAALSPHFTIAKASHPERLPTAHTCSTQLDLPLYPSAAVLRQKLLQAVDLGCVGFGFA